MEDINQEFTDFLSDIGLEIFYPRYFHSGPTHTYNLHVDVSTVPGNRFARLNWIFGGAGSEMVWYKPEGSSISFRTNSHGERIKIFDPAKCKELCRQHLKGPNLVNVGIVHTLVGGTEQRHCYSFFLKNKINSKRVEWDEAAFMFMPYFQR